MTKTSSAIFIVLLVMLVLMTLLYGGVHQPIIALFYLLTLVLTALWSFDAWNRSELPLSRSLLQLPLVGLGLFGSVQVIPFGAGADGGVTAVPRTISADPFATKAAIVQIAMMAIFLAVALAYVDSAKRLRNLVSFLTVFGAIYAFYALLQSVLSPDAIFGIYKPIAAKPFGTFVNRNDFAAMMLMFVALPLGMLFSGAVPRERRLLYVVAAALMGSALLLSQSRGGLVALVCEIILLIIFTTRAHGRKKIVLKAGLSLLFLLAVVGGAIFVGGDTSLVRFKGTDIAAQAPTETTSRFHIWAITTRVIGETFPLGAGLGAYPAVYPRHDTSGGTPRVEQAHNDYLQLVSDAGVVGALFGAAFLYLWAQQAKASLRVRNKFRFGIACGATAGTSAILLQSAFDFVLHITAIAMLFLLLLAMLVRSRSDYEDDLEDDLEHAQPKRRTRSMRPRSS